MAGFLGLAIVKYEHWHIAVNRSGFVLVCFVKIFLNK